MVVVLAQAIFRPGFDLVHDDASVLSNGSMGWIQIANFLLTGAMVIACAVGVRRALTSGPGATWGPILLGVYGLGLIGAGIFIVDPMSGFPPGTPAGRPETVSMHGVLHLVFAAVGFISLAASCMVIGQRFGGEKRQAWAWFSRLTGVLFLLGFGGLASGSDSAAVVIGFWAVLILAWSWLAAVSVNLFRRVS